MNIEQIRGRVAAIKADQPGYDCVAFASGPFLNFYFEDAQVIADTLGVVLNKRHNVAVCSIPGPGIERHAKRLQAAGISVVVDYPETSDSADAAHDDARPIAWRELAADDQTRIIDAMNLAEKNSLRAAALVERLSEYGLADEAQTLGVAGMASYMRCHQLDALEVIIGTIEEAGGLPPSQTRQ